MQALDGLIYLLALTIAVLAVTGGVHYASPTLKLELSQVDAFAWALLGLLALRRWRSGTWLPRKLDELMLAGFAALEKKSLRLLTIGALVYVVLFTWNSAWRYDSFHANAFDLSYVEHAIWSTFRVGFLHTSIARGQTYLGEHFSPILAAAAIPYRVFGSMYFLFLMQSLILASGAFFVYALARQHALSKGWAALAGLCFLAYQPLRLANCFDFREDDFFIPIFFSLLLALSARRWPYFWLFCLLSWTVKENATILTTLLGTWLVIERGFDSEDRRRLRLNGCALALVSMLVFAVVNAKVTPHFAGPSQTMAVRRLPNLGSTNAEILRFVVSHPLAFLREFARPFLQLKTLKYFFDVLTPFVFFASASPGAFAVAVAGLALNVLVNPPTIGFHYECIIIPFLFFVLVRGLARKLPRRSRDKALAPALLMLSFLLFFGRGPFEAIRRNVPTAYDRLIAREFEKIPPGASVATQSVLHPHLTHRENIYLFSKDAPATDYIVVDLSAGRDRYATPNLDADVGAISPSAYEKILVNEGLRIYKRRILK